MSKDLYNALLFGLIALGLLVVDRVFRINPFLQEEGFYVGGNKSRCGVDLPPCSFPLRCMNGFCRGEESPQLYERNPLPVVP